MKTVTVVVDFYEATARWGLSRWFRDVIEVDFKERCVGIRLIDNTVVAVPMTDNIASITVTSDEE
jgi:hypothetical protein